MCFDGGRHGAKSGILNEAFCGNQLPVAPQGDFLCEQKVTKESFRRRGLRFPRLLKTSTLEPPKRNRARFPFDSLQGEGKALANQRLFCAKLILQKSLSAMQNIAPAPRGFQRGIAIPLWLLRVRVHRERGSQNTLSLCASLVTFSASRKLPRGAAGSETL